MKWTTKKHHYGDTRLRVFFAWVPFRGRNGITYWMERVVVREVWTEYLTGYLDQKRNGWAQLVVASFDKAVRGECPGISAKEALSAVKWWR